jgi:hypothetical protein
MWRENCGSGAASRCWFCDDENDSPPNQFGRIRNGCCRTRRHLSSWPRSHPKLSDDEDGSMSDTLDHNTCDERAFIATAGRGGPTPGNAIQLFIESARTPLDSRWREEKLETWRAGRSCRVSLAHGLRAFTDYDAAWDLNQVSRVEVRVWAAAWAAPAALPRDDRLFHGKQGPIAGAHSQVEAFQAWTGYLASPC